MCTQIVIKALLTSFKVRLSCAKVPATPAGALVRITTHRLRFEPLGKSRELPGFQLALHVLVDLML
jgi:hypothetical protein